MAKNKSSYAHGCRALTWRWLGFLLLISSMQLSVICIYSLSLLILVILFVWRVLSWQRNTGRCRRSLWSTICRCWSTTSRWRHKLFVDTLPPEPEMTTSASRRVSERWCWRKSGQCDFWRSTSSATVKRLLHFCNVLLVFSARQHIHRGP